MDLDKLKQRLQAHFSDGLVTIVGCGLSMAEGIPGMGDLATHLIARVPTGLPVGKKYPLWDSIQKELKAGADLESTLLNTPPDATLESIIVNLTAELLLEAETRIIQDVVDGKRVLRFTSLLKHMLKPNTGIPVITANYDRLIEVAAEQANLGVDTLFVGGYLRKLNPRQSQASLCRGTVKKGKNIFRQYADHIVLLKPHGSLDWYRQNAEPISCTLPINNQRLIITPGLNKFRGGYDSPFDSHRERANREIDKGNRYLVVGYGFNDDHLQTHLEPQLRAGKPALILTHTLSEKAKRLVSECTGVIAVCAEGAGPGAMVLTKDESTFFPGPNIWDLKIFINEVLES